jgi:F-type H+-transporting ATPase subunit b
MRRLLERSLTSAVLAIGAPGAIALASEEGGLPQLRQVDTFVSQIFWLVVTFGLLYLMMSRVVLPRIGNVMEERQQKVDDDLSRAEKLKAEAEQVMAEYEAALTESRNKASEFIREADEAMKAEAATRQDAFSRELTEKTKTAEAHISTAKQTALGELAGVAADTAVAVAEKLIAVKPDGKAVKAAVADVLGGRG